MRLWLSSELWALLVPTHPIQDTSPVWKKRAHLDARSEFRDIISTLLHRDGQTLVHLHRKNPSVHTLLPPAWLWLNFSLQDKVKINTGSATFPLLTSMEAAQIFNHENNMEKWSRKAMEGSELASKVPRDPGSSVEDGVVTGTKQILDLEEDCLSLKGHFLCWSLF